MKIRPKLMIFLIFCPIWIDFLTRLMGYLLIFKIYVKVGAFFSSFYSVFWKGKDWNHKMWIVISKYLNENNNPKIMRHFLLLSNYKQDFQQSFSICFYIMEYNTQWKIMYTYQWHYFHNNQLFSSEKKSCCLFTMNIQLFVDFFLLLMEQRSHSRKALTE